MPAYLQQFVVRFARLDGANIDTREKLYDEVRPRQGYLRWTLQFCHPRLARGHPGQPWLRRHATHTSQRFPHAAAVDCAARHIATRLPCPAPGNQLSRSFHIGVAPVRGTTRAPAFGTRPTPRPS